jgi:hypothetical protein
MKITWSTPTSANFRRCVRNVVGRADAASTAHVRHGRCARPRSSSRCRCARLVDAEQVVVREREPEEAEAVERPAARLLARRDDRRSRSPWRRSGWHPADRLTLALERLVVVVDPVPRLARVDERERERADAELGGQWIVSRLEHATHIGGCGFCTGFGTTLRHGIEKNSPWKPGYGSIASMLAHCSRPRATWPRFFDRVDAVALELARDADSPVPQSTRPFETRSSVAIALGDLRRMVVARAAEHDAVAEADALRPLRARGEEHLGRGRVRVLLEEVVLDLPGVVDAERSASST